MLEPAARAGAEIGGFHPLQLFADPEVALAGLPGCTIGIEADGPLLPQLELLAAALGCRTMRLPPGCRVRYHAAAHYAAGCAGRIIRWRAAPVLALRLFFTSGGLG